MTSPDPKAGNDELKRLQAREDYIAMGHKRSRDALFKDYVRRGRDGEIVPTRNRNQFYKWSDEDKWEQIALERLRSEIEDQGKALSDARKRSYINLSLLTDVAIERLLKELQGGDSKLAVDIAKDVLTRVGVVGPDKRAPLKDDPEKPKLELPTADDPDSKIHEFFANVSKRG